MTPDDGATLFLSLKTALAATAVAAVVGTACAAAIAGRAFRGRAVLDGLLLAPLVLPPTVVGYLLLLLLGNAGPLGAVAEALFGQTLLFTWTAAVLAAAVVATPLVYMTVRGALEQIDPSVAGAARTLGATEWRVRTRVLLPMARPGIVAGVVLAFARALGEFGATLMIAGNLPGRTRTVPLAIYTDVESGDLAHAGMWVVAVLVLTVALVAVSNVFRAGRAKAGLV